MRTDQGSLLSVWTRSAERTTSSKSSSSSNCAAPLEDGITTHAHTESSPNSNIMTKFFGWSHSTAMAHSSELRRACITNFPQQRYICACQKEVSPRFHRGSSSFVVSLVPRGGLPKRLNTFNLTFQERALTSPTAQLEDFFSSPDLTYFVGKACFRTPR